MNASTKISQLESKISDLQNQHQRLLKERQQEIAGLIAAVDLAHLDDKTLTGGLIFLKDKITTQDPTGFNLLEAWRDAGEKFLRHTKPKAPSRNQSRQEKKQTEFRSQIADKKDTPSKQTHTPPSTDQSPQKPPQPREV